MFAYFLLIVWRTPSLLRTASGNAMYNPAWTKSNVWCRSDAIAAATRLRTAIVGTGSSFDLSPANAADIEKFGVAVKEMEAAAVVWSCNQFGVPCICLKSITDIVREGEEGTWPPIYFVFINSKTLPSRGVGAPHPCHLGSVSRYLSYADVRMHISMTHRNERYRRPWRVQRKPLRCSNGCTCRTPAACTEGCCKRGGMKVHLGRARCFKKAFLKFSLSSKINNAEVFTIFSHEIRMLLIWTCFD